ncbi:integrase core domain-containing protein [Actinomadura coerulea]|uniref:integrase core domain-containing protein n=1 Tax=Actinomadura coerulea TaxID=46159 RepID=UPI0034449319
MSRSSRPTTAPKFQTGFHWHVLDKGIAHTYIKPASPHLNGKVERSHRIDAEEFYRMLDGVVIDDTGVFNDRLPEWEDYYNYDRPPRSPRRPDPLRTSQAEDPGPGVTKLRQMHTVGRRPARGQRRGGPTRCNRPWWLRTRSSGWVRLTQGRSLDEVTDAEPLSPATSRGPGPPDAHRPPDETSGRRSRRPTSLSAFGGSGTPCRGVNTHGRALDLHESLPDNAPSGDDLDEGAGLRARQRVLCRDATAARFRGAAKSTAMSGATE